MMAVYGRNLLWEAKGTIKLHCIRKYIVWNKFIKDTIQSLIFVRCSERSVKKKSKFTLHCKFCETVELPWNFEYWSKLVLALASTVILVFGSHRDSWPYFRSFKWFMCLKMGAPIQQGKELVFLSMRHTRCTSIQYQCTRTYTVSR
jgi:hypothetical protein